MNGDYDNAYEDAYEADYAAYQIYQYTGDNSAYTQELSNTIYLCSWLCKERARRIPTTPLISTRYFLRSQSPKFRTVFCR